MNNSGFLFEERKSPEFPANQQRIDIAKWNREHEIGKPAAVSELSELEKLRKQAEKNELW
jgi:hypothetical protein